MDHRSRQRSSDPPLAAVRTIALSLRVADLALSATIGALNDIAADLRATVHDDDQPPDSTPVKFPGYL